MYLWRVTMIEIKNFSFRYRGTDTLSLKKINLTIQKGECVLLSGRSGCGKTTLLRALNGLIPHFYDGGIEGEVIVENMDIMETPMYRLSEKIGTVYQNPRSQFFNIDTDSEVAFGIENLAYPKEELKRRISNTIAKTDTRDLMGRNIFDLSGGEKQKIAIASVYAMEPTVFLLDEPSANLDNEATENLKERILELKQAGKTIVITEHRLYYLKDIIDRAIYLENGEIIADFTEKEFFSLDKSTLNSYGLRTLNLDKVVVEGKPINTQPVVQVEKLYAGYKKETILHNLSFTVNGGEIVAIIGNNGAGKTTLSQVLCGLHPIQSGKIRYNGRNLTKKQCVENSYMVFQDVDYQLFADSVLSECSYGRKNTDEEVALSVLCEMNLSEFTQRHPATLSGGQKQRLAVAVGVLCNKNIMIFDEPTSGLDKNSMERVATFVKELSKKGKTIFVVTHDYEFICKCCTRVLRINEGQLDENYTLSSKTQAQLKIHY